MEQHPHGSTPKPGSNTQFGLVFTVVLAIIGLWPASVGQPPRFWALLFAAGLTICTLIRPALLAPLNRCWFRFGLLVQRITNPVVLLVIFGCVIVPTGLLMRLTGRDPLKRKLDPKANSYWVERTPPGRPDDSMKNQF
jgi:hypothetical protein